MRAMILILLIASTLTQYAHYVQVSQEAQQLFDEMHVEDVPETEAVTAEVETVTDDERNDYDVLIGGEWKLYLADMDDEMQYFDDDSSFSMHLEFNEDQTVYLYEFTDGVQTLFKSMDIEYDDIYVSFICDDPDILPESIAYEEYLVLNSDDNFMSIYLMFYDEDDYLEGGYTLYFERW